MKQFGIMMTRDSVHGLLREVKEPGTGKTQTRRLAERTIIKARDSKWGSDVKVPSIWVDVKPGDLLWVRERLVMSDSGGAWMHEADRNVIVMDRSDRRAAEMIGWAHHQEKDACSARHMPKWASRFTLIVTGTKTEHLHDISEADAILEGIERVTHPDYPGEVAFKSFETYPDGTDHPHAAAPMKFAADSYRQLWQQLHGHKSWEANPLVVAITFKVVLAHIDTAEARRAA